MEHPFISIAQGENLHKIVIMPLWAFQKLADDLGDPKYKEVSFTF